MPLHLETLNDITAEGRQAIMNLASLVQSWVLIEDEETSVDGFRRESVSGASGMGVYC